MIKEAYCSYEVAKLLKEKGFDEPCYQKYDCNGDLSFNHVGYINDENPCEDFCALAPTHQMAMAWLRDVHHIAINIGWGEVFEEQYRWWSIVLNMDNGDILYDENYQASYEESVETTLKYCLENLI